MSHYEYLLNRLVQRISTLPREEHVINEAPEGLKSIRYVREDWMLKTIRDVLEEMNVAMTESGSVR